MAGDYDENLTRPDWYADPVGRHQYRYWDGSGWTAQVADSGNASLDPLDVRPAQEASAANEPCSGMTLVGFFSDFLLRNQDDVKLADMDAMREIVNSGCSPAVVQRHRAFGSRTVKQFLEELAEHRFIGGTS